MIERCHRTTGLPIRCGRIDVSSLGHERRRIGVEVEARSNAGPEARCPRFTGEHLVGNQNLLRRESSSSSARWPRAGDREQSSPPAAAVERQLMRPRPSTAGLWAAAVRLDTEPGLLTDHQSGTIPVCPAPNPLVARSGAPRRLEPSGFPRRYGAAWLLMPSAADGVSRPTCWPSCAATSGRTSTLPPRRKRSLPRCAAARSAYPTRTGKR